MESLPENDDDAPIVVDEELEAEIERRLAERQSGRAKTFTIEEVMQDLRSIVGRAPDCAD
ncbi:MAG: addiction module protein [Pirellulaceae bacterium]|nr:addiction module protein [Pirellulaceae bacterium]